MRLEIFKNDSEIVNGRQNDTPKSYYSCSVISIKDFYGDEFYKSQSIGWKNAVTFKIRYCKKVADIYGSDYQSKFFIMFKEHKYEIKNLDFHNMKKDFIYLKCCMV